MKIAIYSQFYNKAAHAPLQTLFSLLKKHDVEVALEESYKDLLAPHLPEALNCTTFDHEQGLDPSYDLLLSLGGDGTMLRALTYVVHHGIPVVGINMGRLGFLATVQKEAIEEALSQIITGNYSIEERTLLTIQGEPAIAEFGHLNFALNEVAVSRKNTTSMIAVSTYLDNEYLNTYWADGLIIATPTGSTGYSLSCGGPVISPNTGGLVITPIAPHNLNARPLVIEDNISITLKTSGRGKSHLISLDSRMATLENDTLIHIEKASLTLKMIKLPEESFFETLRKKLLWGEDKRN